MIDLKGKTAVVTGAGRGLGRQIALDFAQAGCNVSFNFHKDIESAGSLAEELKEHNIDVFFKQLDVSSYQEVEKFTDETIERFGKIDILVNNAGIVRGAYVWDMSEDDWDLVVNTNLKGTFNHIRFVSKYMMNEKNGKIINISSINGLRGREGSISYNASKGGIDALTKSAARELGIYNINVNAIAPGFINTESQKKTPALIKKLVIDECAIKRLGEPSDISKAVLFLSSSMAKHITGQIIKVDAGQYI